MGNNMGSLTPIGLDKPVGLLDSTESWSVRGDRCETEIRTAEPLCYDTDQILNSI